MRSALTAAVGVAKMATAVAIQEAGVYTCRHGDKRLSAEKRRLRAGKANVVKADGSTGATAL